MGKVVARKSNRLFKCLPCLLVFRSAVSGVGFWLVKETHLQVSGQNPYSLTWAWLGTVGIHLPGIDLVIAGRQVSCLLQVVHVVLFFGGLKY